TELLAKEFGFVLKSASNGSDPRGRGGGDPQTDPQLVAAALAVIPHNADWGQWNAVGMAAWRATRGSAGGVQGFPPRAQKSPKYDARTTAEKWAAFFKSPPTHIGAGTIFHLADQVSPTWREEYEARKRGPKPGPIEDWIPTTMTTKTTIASNLGNALLGLR